MKRILFILSRFLDGGIDMVLVDYLRKLSTSTEYDIALAISIKMDELEVFTKAIPPQVKVYHLVDNKALTYWRKRKITCHLPLFAKLYDEILLSAFRRRIIGNKIKELAKEYDVVIDFDSCHYSYLENVSVKKIAWFHFSFKHLMTQNPRRTQRIGKKFATYDRIVVISKAMLEEGQELFPWLDNRWRLIYNAKDKDLLIQRAQEHVDDPRIQQQYILAVERLEESQKDLTTLIRAYHLLKEKYCVKEKLYLLGKGRDEEELRQLATSLGLQEEVVFLGFHNNPYPWIHQARIIAHSAKMEGLPTVLIESLILGKLIVSSDCPTGPREILNDGKAGLLVPVGDAEEMCEAMHRLLTDEALAKDIARNIQGHQQNFLFDKTITQFREVINSL